MNDLPYHSRHPQIVTTSGGQVCCLWEDGSYHDGTNWLGDAALYASLRMTMEKLGLDQSASRL